MHIRVYDLSYVYKKLQNIVSSLISKYKLSMKMYWVYLTLHTDISIKKTNIVTPKLEKKSFRVKRNLFLNPICTGGGWEHFQEFIIREHVKEEQNESRCMMFLTLSIITLKIMQNHQNILLGQIILHLRGLEDQISRSPVPETFK